jgi:hypothetical protein
MLVRRRTWGLLLCLTGCIAYEQHAEDSTGGADESSSSGGTSSANGADTGEATTATPTTGDDPIDGECDLWAQDCPDGSKCMPVDTDADGIHDASKCVPLAQSPGQGGDPCQVEGSPASGVDDCDIGLLCWGVNADNQGGCVQMCSGTPSMPTCPNGLLCDVSNGGALILCLKPCDPLTPSCPNGKICLPTAEGVFVCDTDASGDEGMFGDECEYLNVCDDGLLCAPSNAVPGCNSQACCTEYCDLDSDVNNCTGAPQGQECVPFYDPGFAPPGYEDVGVCTLPM